MKMKVFFLERERERERGGGGGGGGGCGGGVGRSMYTLNYVYQNLMNGWRKIN